jgi:hypothetical protein
MDALPCIARAFSGGEVSGPDELVKTVIGRINIEDVGWACRVRSAMEQGIASGDVGGWVVGGGGTGAGSDGWFSKVVTRIARVARLV